MDAGPPEFRAVGAPLLLAAEQPKTVHGPVFSMEQPERLHADPHRIRMLAAFFICCLFPTRGERAQRREPLDPDFRFDFPADRYRTPTPVSMQCSSQALRGGRVASML